MVQHSDSGKQRYCLDLIRLWQQSRLSVRGFCRRHRLSEPSFYCWRRTLRQRGLIGREAANAAANLETPAFVQVTVAAGAAPKSIEVVLAKGRHCAFGRASMSTHSGNCCVCWRNRHVKLILAGTGLPVHAADRHAQEL